MCFLLGRNWFFLSAFLFFWGGGARTGLLGLVPKLQAVWTTLYMVFQWVYLSIRGSAIKYLVEKLCLVYVLWNVFLNLDRGARCVWRVAHSLLQSGTVSIGPTDRISIPNSLLITTPRPILWLTLQSVQWVPASLTFRLLMSYIYGAPILDVSRSHTTTQHSR